MSPAEANEVETRGQLERIGIGPRKTFYFQDLSPKDKAEILLGMKEGEAKVEEAVANTGKNINGWRVGGLAGGDQEGVSIKHSIFGSRLSHTAV